MIIFRMVKSSIPRDALPNITVKSSSRRDTLRIFKLLVCNDRQIHRGISGEILDNFGIIHEGSFTN